MNVEEVLDEAIRARAADTVALRRFLHQHPELSREEFRTTDYLVERLRGLGLNAKVRTAGTGFYADIECDGFDPSRHKTVGIRCDLDALAIEEQTGLEFASKHPGVMHACGHDVHMSIVTAVGEAFTNIDVPGRVRLIYQHAEETTPGGSIEMIEFGAIDGVDFMLGLHVDPTYEVGSIGVKSGAFTAAFDVVEVTIQGMSGHGARPHHSVDPIFVMTQALNALYQAIGRHIDSRDPMVFSVGRVSGGAANNIIPDTAFFGGSVRTVSLENRAKIEPLFRQILDGVCCAHGATYTLSMQPGAPAIINDAAVTDVIRQTGRALLGADWVHEIELPSMGSEDFSNYLTQVPGAMFRLGIRAGDSTAHGLHSAHFAIDERALEIGARVVARSAYALLSR